MTPPPTAPCGLRESRLTAVALAVIHLAIALFYRHAGGVRITADAERDRWDWFWQTLPTELLQDDMLRSVWHLHAQPPVHNLLGGTLIKLFHPNHLEWLHHGQMVLGALIVAMTHRITATLTGGRWLPLLAGALVALSPALILYEAYILYTLLATFLLTGAVWSLMQYHSAPRLRYLLAFVALLNVLMLTRTMFHIALLGVVLPFVAVLARERWRSALVWAILVSLPTVGWYTKNQVQFGFFGATSWTGQNLWKIATSNIPREDLPRVYRAAKIDRAVASHRVFVAPSRFRPYGFDAKSDVPALQRNDFHNINMVGISRLYGENAVRLIAHDPGQYLRTVGFAYSVFCRPASDYDYVYANRTRLGPHESLYNDWILGRAPARWLGRTTAIQPGSHFYFLIPIALLAHLILLIARTRGRPRAVVKMLAEAPALTFLAFVITFTSVVSCCFDYEENMRFRFVIEPMLFAYFAAVATSVVRPKSATYVTDFGRTTLAQPIDPLVDAMAHPLGELGIEHHDREGPHRRQDHEEEQHRGETPTTRPGDQPD